MVILHELAPWISGSMSLDPKEKDGMGNQHEAASVVPHLPTTTGGTAVRVPLEELVQAVTWGGGWPEEGSAWPKVSVSG